MSAQDSRPAPQRRKLVLRKIADGGARAPANAEAASSYTGPRPTIRPPSYAPETVKSRQSLVLPLESEPVLEPDELGPDAFAADEEAPSEAAPATAPWAPSPQEDWRTYGEAGAAAAMTPAAPREVPVTARSASHAWGGAAAAVAAPKSGAQMRAIAPAAPHEASLRPSVAPVVSTLPPIGVAPQLPPQRSPMSADSKLLAAGGALAAAMLLVALGVLLGQRSTSPAPSAAGTGSYPLVVETRAPAATALPAAPTRPVEARPAIADTPVERVDSPATIDVQKLPPAARPRPQGWSVVAPTAKPAGSGWTVAAPIVRPGAAPAPTGEARAQGGAAASDQAPPVASAAPVAPEAPAASAPPPVDTFVQAVRDDIREDESRGSAK